MATSELKMSTARMEHKTSEDDAVVQTALQETTWFQIIFAVWVGLFGWLANFDAAFGGIVLVMEPYISSFGTCIDTPSGPQCSITALQQALVQLTVLFEGVGGALAAFSGHYIGRRGTVQMGCLLIAIGAAGMIGSDGNFTNYMVCKCIGGVGIGQLYSAAPTWGAESVSARKRGFLMCLYNVGLGAGNVVAGAVCVGSSHLKTNWAWRTPIACQIPLALLWMGISVLFPESPRWLLTKGREDKARRSFAKYNGTSPNSVEVTDQVNDVLRHIEIERDMNRETSWLEIFRGLHLKRTHIAVLVLLGNALTGIQFVIPYTALFLASVGLTNPFTLNVAISSCVLAGAIPGPFICEYIGRRRGLIGGYCIMALSMLIFAAVSSGLSQSSPMAQRVLVSFLCIWAFTFGATSGPLVWVASPEMHSLRLRTSGQSYAVFMYEVFSFGAAFWTPYMLNPSYGNMGTNVGYFYFGITVIVIILTALFVPELGRLSLEQIDEHFLGGISARQTSLKKNKRIAQAVGRKREAKDVE